MSEHRDRCLAALEKYEQTGEQPKSHKHPKEPPKPRGRFHKDLTGEQIGRWVLYQFEFRNGRPGWVCVCQCPAHTEKWVRTDSLLSGKSKGCRKCQRRKQRKIDPRRRESLEYLKRTDPEGLKRNLRPFEYEIIFGEPRSPEEHASYLEREKQ